MDCAEATRRVLDGKPGTEMEAPLALHLESCADCGDLARQHAALSRAAAELRLRAHPRVWAEIQRRVRPQPSPGSLWRQAVEALLAPRRWPALGAVAALALVLLVLGGTGPDRLAYRASGSVIASDVGALAAAGQLVPRSQELMVEAEASLRLEPRPGETIEVEGPARLRLLATRRLELALGRVRVEVEPGHGGLMLDLPQGQIRVVGTVFTVELGLAGALVTLMRGKLELRPLAGPPAALRAGEFARLTPTGVEQVEPAAHPVPPLPRAGQTAVPAMEPRTGPESPERPRTVEPASRLPVSSTRPGRKASGGF